MKEKGYELDTDLLKSIASTYVDIQEPKNEENFKCSEKEVVKVEEIKPEVIDSLTKLSVNLPSKYQIQKSTKVNVLSLPMPPVSTNSFDISPSPEVDVKDVTVTKIPLPQDSAKDNIKLGESYFKDNKYNNIKASDIFSPAPKVRPSIIIPKRPSVIKSTPPIDHPNRELNEFNKLLKVGEGSYGTVYKALDIRSNELVAMKRVRMEHEHEGWLIIKLIQR